MMVKSKRNVLAVLIVAALAFLTIGFAKQNVKANADGEDGFSATLSNVKYNVSNDGAYTLLAATITTENMNRIYEVGFYAYDGEDKVELAPVAAASKTTYYTSINEADSKTIFGTGTALPMIVWKVATPNAAVSYEAYVKYGYINENDNNNLWSYATEKTVSGAKKAVSFYTVTIDEDGGDAVADLTVIAGTPASALSGVTVTKTGYHYDAWEYEASAGVWEDLPSSATVTENVTVRPKWNATTYYATFKNGEDTVGEPVPYTIESVSIVEPAVPAKGGYNGAWSAYDLTTVGGITVNAIYTLKNYLDYDIYESLSDVDMRTAGETASIALPAEVAGYQPVYAKLNDADADVQVNAAGTSADVSVSALSLGENTLRIFMYSGEEVATAEVTVTKATMVIDDKADLDAFGAVLQAGNASVGTYYVLGADVDYEGAQWSYSDTPAVSFGGTFDGRGYAVKNYKCLRGLFATVAAGATIKNLAMTGVTIDGDYTGAGICTYLYGAIDNCAVVADVMKRSSRTPIAGASAYVYAGATVNNCITKIFYREAYIAFNGITDSNAGTINNVYSVSANSPAMYPNNTSGLYKTDAAFFAAVDTLSEANGWNEYWNIESDELFFGENKIIEKGITDKTASVYYDFDLSLDVTDYTIDITNIDAALTTNAGITKVTLANGSPIPFTKSGTDSIVIAKSFASTRLGEKEVIISTDSAQYMIVLCFASNVLNNKSEFNTYFSANEGKTTAFFTYVVLKSDIDLEGTTWSYGNNTSSVFRGTFDGRGHKVENFTVNRGLFCKINAYSTVKNLLVKDTIHGSYGGAGIAFYNYGLIENCAVVMETLNRTDRTGIAGIAAYTYNAGEVQVRNCIAKVFYRDAFLPFKAIVDTQQSGSLAANCYAVSSLSPAMWGSSTDGLYRTDSAFFAAVNSLPAADGWSKYWSIVDGELFMGENKVIEKGITDKTANVYYDFDLSLGVSGYTMDITNIDAALTTNAAIVSVKYAGGISIPFTTSGTDSIVIPATAVSNRRGERELIVETSTTKYMIVVCIASQVIHNKAELDAFAAASVGKTISASTYIVLAADINYENGTWTYADNGASVFRGKFDGRGHTISNITFNNAFFGTINTLGKVMNLNLSGVTVSDGSYTGSNIAKTNSGEIVNCNVE